jgi:hypothetical protein
MVEQIGAFKGGFTEEADKSTIPVYDGKHVDATAFRVQTPQGPGVIATADPDEAENPRLRIETDTGTEAVNYSTIDFPLVWEDFEFGLDDYVEPGYYGGDQDIDGFVVEDDIEDSSLKCLRSDYDTSNFSDPNDTFHVEIYTQKTDPFYTPAPGKIWSFDFRFSEANSASTAIHTFGSPNNDVVVGYYFEADTENDQILLANIPKYTDRRTRKYSILPFFNESFNWQNNTYYRAKLYWTLNYRFGLRLYTGSNFNNLVFENMGNYRIDVRRHRGTGFGWAAKREVRFRELFQRDEYLP